MKAKRRLWPKLWLDINEYEKGCYTWVLQRIPRHREHPIIRFTGGDYCSRARAKSAALRFAKTRGLEIMNDSET